MQKSFHPQDPSACHPAAAPGCLASILSAAAPPLPCIRMAGCGLPRPAAKSLQSGRGFLPRHQEPQLVFATLLQCSHPLEPVPCLCDVFPLPWRKRVFPLLLACISTLTSMKGGEG